MLVYFLKGAAPTVMQVMLSTYFGAGFLISKYAGDEIATRAEKAADGRFSSLQRALVYAIWADSSERYSQYHISPFAAKRERKSFIERSRSDAAPPRKLTIELFILGDDATNSRY